MDILVKAGQLLLSLSILVIFHEFGHFAFAKLFKTRVEKFYLFFNPWFSLFKTKWGETEYGIGWLPLGGYVKISGMIDESMDKEQMKQPPQPWEFRTKTTWQRLLIMLGGVLVNFILAFLIYTMILTVWGRQYLPAENLKFGVAVDSLGYELGLRNGDKILSLDGEKVVEFSRIVPDMILDETKTVQVERNGQVLDIKLDPKKTNQIVKLKSKPVDIRVPFIVGGFPDESPARDAGMEVNDKIVGINDSTVEFFNEFAALIKKYKGKEVSIKVLRDNGPKEINLRVTDDGMIGVANGYNIVDEFGIKTLEYSFFEAIPASFPMGYRLITDQLKQLKLIPQHADQLGGFIAIGGIFPATWDWERFWTLTAMLSIMLAVLNLLPIPALDGGHVMFLLYEMITSRKPSEKFMEYAQMVGIVLLLGLLLFVNGNDIFKLIFK
ncbi:MAG: RIP metalloprotease RseP [Bacteroidales bacterium]|nr:RIP metalloprotease RseP [Bacteroidales bacterium]